MYENSTFTMQAHSYTWLHTWAEVAVESPGHLSVGPTPGRSGLTPSESPVSTSLSYAKFRRAPQWCLWAGQSWYTPKPLPRDLGNVSWKGTSWDCPWYHLQLSPNHFTKMCSPRSCVISTKNTSGHVIFLWPNCAIICPKWRAKWVFENKNYAAIKTVAHFPKDTAIIQKINNMTGPFVPHCTTQLMEI